jgi:hypothetical protein
MGAPVERLPLTSHRGFAAYAEAAPVAVPKRMALVAYRALGEAERRAYDAARRLCHNHLGPYRLLDVGQASGEILELVEQNEYLPESRVRPGAAIDGEPSLGKTTLLTRIGREWHLAQRALNPGGLMDGAMNLHIPVCYVSLPGDCSIKGLNQALAVFYELPDVRRETAINLGTRVKRAMRECGTSLVLIDDLHFIRPGQRDGRTLSDHLKNLMSEVPATFVFAGVELEQAGIFGNFAKGAMRNVSANQTGERLRRFAIARIDITTAAGRKQWKGLVSAMSNDLCLCCEPQLCDPDTLAYLHARTGGSVGALAELVRVASARVMRREADLGCEEPVLDRALLEQVRLSHGTEERAKRAPKPVTKSAERLAAAA